MIIKIEKELCNPINGEIVGPKYHVVTIDEEGKREVLETFDGDIKEAAAYAQRKLDFNELEIVYNENPNVFKSVIPGMELNNDEKNFVSLITPFTAEEYKEMKDFLEAQRIPEHGCYQWRRGKEPRWKVGNILAYYERYSDYEGEQILGEIIKIEYDDYLNDWTYYFKDYKVEDGEYWRPEESLFDEGCYIISKEYYEKDCPIKEAPEEMYK